MNGDKHDVELRVEGVSSEEDLSLVRRALGDLDASAAVRLDAQTGILHITTIREALEVTATLDGAGLRASAMTG